MFKRLLTIFFALFLNVEAAQPLDRFPVEKEVVQLANAEPIFDNIPPTFILQGDLSSCDQMRWQISSDPDFSIVSPDFDVIQEAASLVTLDNMDETLLNAGTDYFFRVKVHSNDWSDWSDPFLFQVNALIDEKSLNISEETWQVVRPYLLPDNHPAKKALDKIFSSSRVLESAQSMRKAGFNVFKHKHKTMKIAQHPKLDGYLIKAFLDSEDIQEWFWWKKRIDGAQTIQKSIEKHGYLHLMKVPKKWIYALPPGPKSKVANPRKFILVVEDMDILSDKKNLAAYKKNVTREQLDAIFTIVNENLLIDSVWVDNIPFSKDGKIAFIDTEHFNDTTQQLKLFRFAQYLSPEMHLYWEGLLVNGGPGK